MANKWTFKKKAPKLQNDKALAKLFNFYVVNCPAKGVSLKAKTLADLGWSGPKLNTLQAMMRAGSGFPNAGTWIDATQPHIEEKLNELNVLGSYSCEFEFAVHTVRDDLNKTEALFYFIRNAFAHGGFRIHKFDGERWLAFENRQGEKLKGRALIKESTLNHWANLLDKPRKER